MVVLAIAAAATRPLLAGFLAVASARAVAASGEAGVRQGL